jgi:hypothetical protein
VPRANVNRANANVRPGNVNDNRRPVAPRPTPAAVPNPTRTRPSP